MLFLLHRVTTAALLVAGLAGLASCGPDKPAGGGETSRVAGDPAHLDGDWAVLRIDSAPVGPDSFRIQLRRGEVTGGHDGCNNWGYDESVPPLADGSRMIVSDAQGCPETAQSRAYRAVVAKPAITPEAGDRLLLTGGGHRLLVARCTWVTVREERPRYSSQRQSCRTVEPRPA